jgi:hypothetical protein
MSTLAEFLKGKVNESLTKLVQPAGLVPATLLILLNLAFIYPALKGEVGFLGAFADLDPTWQVVVVATLILFLGYLLLSASSSIVDLLAGESWRGSWLYESLSKRRQDALFAGTLAVVPVDDSRRALSDAWELRASYPIVGVAAPGASNEQRRALVEDVGPTALGNVLHASRRLIFDRWGIDASALWPQMEVLLPEDAAARSAVTDAKASLDTLANVAFVLGLFAVEGIVLHSARGAWTMALLSALAFPAAYIAYRAAVAKARGFGDAMEVVFDLYRGDLHTKLGLAKHVSASEERKRWERVSKLFLWGRPGVATPDDVFEAEPAAAPTPATITASRNLQLARHREEAFDVPGASAAPGALRGRYIEYELVATRRGDLPAEGFITVTDERVPRIVDVPTLNVIPAQATTPRGQIEATSIGAPSTLVWLLPHLAPGASIWLAFTLPVWEVEAAPGLGIAELEQRGDDLSYDVTVVVAQQAAPAQPWLEVYVAATTLTPVLLLNRDKRLAQANGRRHRFDLTGIALPVTVLISFQPRRRIG